jgi:hypothetical protein
VAADIRTMESPPSSTLGSQRLRNGTSATLTAPAPALGHAGAGSYAIAEGRTDNARHRSMRRSHGPVSQLGFGREHDAIRCRSRHEQSVITGAHTLPFTMTQEGHEATTPVLPSAAS